MFLKNFTGDFLMFSYVVRINFSFHERHDVKNVSAAINTNLDIKYHIPCSAMTDLDLPVTCYSVIIAQVKCNSFYKLSA